MPSPELVDALRLAGPVIALILVLLVMIVVVGGLGIFAIRAAARAGQSIAVSHQAMTEALTRLMDQQATLVNRIDDVPQAMDRLRTEIQTNHREIKQTVTEVLVKVNDLPTEFLRQLLRERETGSLSSRRRGLFGGIFG